MLSYFSLFVNIYSNIFSVTNTKWNKLYYRTLCEQIGFSAELPPGIPIDAVMDIEDYEEIPRQMAAAGEFFALRICGDSMEPKIENGDIVIVRRQPDCESDDIAIVLVNHDEATCKKIRKLPNGIMLISTNPKYDPMIFTNHDIEELPVTILGKVVELRAKF